VTDVTVRYGITNAFAPEVLNQVGSKPNKGGQPPPTERAKRGITYALRDEIEAIRLMPLGKERDEANRVMDRIIKGIRSLEPRLLGDYFRAEPRECRR
jgi:hypothetical protein